jgi:hypothetical protein
LSCATVLGDQYSENVASFCARLTLSFIYESMMRLLNQHVRPTSEQNTIRHAIASAF